MEISELKIKPKDVTKDCTIKVSFDGLKTFKVKLWIAAILCTMAGRLIGAKVEIV